MDRNEASRVEDSRFYLLVNAITDYAIYMLDRDGNITSWNPGAERFKGYEASEIIGQHFSTFYTDEDKRDGLPAQALATAGREGKYEDEGWRLRKDGSRFWAHVVIDPIHDPDDSGDVIGYAKITRDLTEQLAAKQALRRSENQFSLLVQNVTAYAIYLLDLDGNVSSWNSGAERIKGYARSEVIGQHFSLFYTQHARDKGEPMQALHTTAPEGHFATEGWRVRRDGSIFWASVVIDVILDQGEITGFAKVTRDLTAAKKAELDLERARDALVRSQKIEAVGHLTGGLAHDFNRILTSVLQSLEVLQKHSAADPDIVPLLDGACQATRRGLSLTQRMMAFARRQELQPEVTDLRQLVTGIMPVLVRSVGPSISIETRIPNLLDPVRIDPGQLEVALLNLTLNARDAMPDGGKILIGAQEEDVESDGADGHLAGGRYIRLSLGDDGDGMDERILVQASETLFSTKYPDQGAGLGLAMVAGFAERSGGRFILRSKKGKGTVAELWLPVSANPAGVLADNEPHVVAKAPYRRTRSIPALAVLAVDNDRFSLMQTSTMLNELGYKVFTATSGEATLAMLRSREAIDVVIIDHSMPGLSGPELVEAIKLEWPTMVVIFATPLAHARLQQIAKPVRRDDLAAAMIKALPRPAAAIPQKVV